MRGFVGPHCVGQAYKQQPGVPVVVALGPRRHRAGELRNGVGLCPLRDASTGTGKKPPAGIVNTQVPMVRSFIPYGTPREKTLRANKLEISPPTYLRTM